jgi:translation initiation factor eIF-2B subunit alpha/methylthioribose-1-phosphate isomerase
MRVQFKGREENYRTVWMDGHVVHMIDQLKLPYKFSIHHSENHLTTAQAIKDMVVRGAPAIGATAAFGLAQAAFDYNGNDFMAFLRHMEEAKNKLKETRPTAYDLFYALDYAMAGMKKTATVSEARSRLQAAAQKYADESAERCRMIGLNGERLIPDEAKILTHCNAGALGCVDYGTALAPIRSANDLGRRPYVFVDETRPRCQGARLTAWELAQERIEHAIIVDNAAGYFMRKGEIDLVIVGADRITLNGDVINKIGTYEKAVLAKENGIPFYVAAPRSTFDPHLGTGDEVEIEERGEDEVLCAWGESEGKMLKVRVAPAESKARNPGFDVTPAEYVTKIITEDGVYPPKEFSGSGR